MNKERQIIKKALLEEGIKPVRWVKNPDGVDILYQQGYSWPRLTPNKVIFTANTDAECEKMASAVALNLTSKGFIVEWDTSYLTLKGHKDENATVYPDFDAVVSISENAMEINATLNEGHVQVRQVLDFGTRIHHNEVYVKHPDGEFREVSQNTVIFSKAMRHIINLKTTHELWK